MKKLFIPASLMLLLLSCKENRKEPGSVIHSQPYKETMIEDDPNPLTYTPTTINYYMFTAVNVRYNASYMNDNYSYKIITSGISEYSNKPTKDVEYMVMDQLSSSFDVKHLRNYSIAKRKAYVFTSYAEASEKRQQILKTGVK